ncbi:MAG: hypothetical protein ACQGVK_14705 [Myxococcota bacterium]
MSESEDARLPVSEIQVDADNLYREEVFTDLKVATLRRLTPVQRDGSPDTSRPALWSGETQLMSQVGMVPVHAPIEAANLAEAIEKFPKAVAEAVERLIEEAREHQRREASRIVVPGQPGGGVVPGGGIPGMPGGKLDLK